MSSGAFRLVLPRGDVAWSDPMNNFSSVEKSQRRCDLVRTTIVPL
jgi:hypothetical protein